MKEDLDELIVLSHTDRATPAEADQLRRWRASSPDNEDYYRSFVAVWQLTGHHPAGSLQGEVPSAHELLGQKRRRTDTQAPPRPVAGSAPVRFGLRRGLVAAVLVLLLGSGIAYSVVSRAPEAVATAEFRTGPNELSTVVLDDGTMVRIAPSSRLSVSFDEERRQVRLNGRAFFAVTPDPERPFDVVTQDGLVQVLGTRFDLETKGGREGTRLLVLDGEVALSSDAGESRLQRGDLATTSSSSPPSVEKVEDPERMLTWLGAWVAFEGTPLHRVARELELRLGVSMEIVDPHIADRTVVGWFAQEDRDEMIDMVCRVADVNCRWTDGGVVVSERVR